MPDNTKKRKPPKNAWKPGQSGNPRGAPKHGESWASVLTWAANLTGEEAAKIVPPELASAFKNLKGLKLKEAVALRVMAVLLDNPTGPLFNAVLDRVEGKVNQNIGIIDWRKEATEQGYDPDELVRQFAAAMVAASLSGSEQTDSDD